MSTLRIPPELTIYGAAELRAQLVAAFADAGSHAELTLDLGDVCEVDSAGIQLLIAARRHAVSNGAALALVNHSAVLLDAFNLLGLDEQADQCIEPLEASLS